MSLSLSLGLLYEGCLTSTLLLQLANLQTFGLDCNQDKISLLHDCLEVIDDIIWA